MSKQKIESPTRAEIDELANAVLHASETLKEACGSGLDGSRDDLTLIQQLLDGGTVEREATYTLQALGIAFGMVFVNQNPDDYDWWMVEDAVGRDPAIRYRDTHLLIFPKSLLARRVEEGERIDVVDLFDRLECRLQELVRDQFAEE